MKFIIKCVLVFTFVFLNGCDMYTSHVNPAQSKPYLNKRLQISQPMVLVQTRDPRPWGENYYYLIPAPATTSSWQGAYSGVIQQEIPSVNDFRNSKTKWQNWQGSPLFNQSRVLGIVVPGTSFHISRITTAPYLNPEVEIIIDSGTFYGIKALSVEPKKLVPVNILREQN